MPDFDRTIPPGGRGKITIMVDTSHYTGDIKKSAMVYTNDPNRKQFMVGLQGRILPLFKGEPALQLKIDTTLGKPASSTIVLNSLYPEPLDIKLVKTTFKDGAKAEWKAVREGREFELTLTTDAAREDHGFGYVVIEFNNPGLKGVGIQSHINVNRP